MKNPRPKYREELEKNQAKIAELQARNRELQKKIRESENTDILGLVRAVNMTPEELAEFLKKVKPAFTPAETAEEAEDTAEPEEENETEVHTEDEET